MPDRKLRILVAKPGLDGHDRGAKIIARALRDAGMEVIYTGLHQTPEMIVSAAIQEDVDAIGMSIMSGAHMTLFPAVIDLLKKEGANEIRVFGGGIIPDDDIPRLKDLGVTAIFTPGSSTQDIVQWIRQNIQPLDRFVAVFIRHLVAVLDNLRRVADKIFHPFRVRLAVAVFYDLED